MAIHSGPRSVGLVRARVPHRDIEPLAHLADKGRLADLPRPGQDLDEAPRPAQSSFQLGTRATLELGP
jgi:hypothetical protein